MIPSLYLNKAVISLDYVQIGNVVDEENDMLLLIDSYTYLQSNFS
jgi:hypothetical protein